MNDGWKRRGGSRRSFRVRAGCWMLVAVPLGLACSNQRQGAPPAVPVTVARAEQRTVPFEITAPGTVEPMRAVALSAQVTGIVTSVRFREGDDVREGEVLLQIDSRPYRNALQQAQATLERDLIQLANARRQVERYKGLAQSEYITSEQFEALEATAQSLEATIQSDSATVDNARLNLEYTTVRAPISGRTGSLLIKEGNVVRAQGSGPLVTLNQTRPILVRFAVPAPFLPIIRQHQGGDLAVHVHPTNDTASLAGTLIFVDNAVDTTTGTIMLKARLPNTDGQLWPGQFVTATLVLYEERDVVMVPVPAVVESEGGNYVYVVDQDNRAQTRPVVVGRTVGDDVVVTQGLTPGETVVTDGQLRLVPGARVQIRNLQAPVVGNQPAPVGTEPAPRRGRS